MRLRLPQTAVYWAAAGFDGQGRPKLAAPVPLPCRWEADTVETIGPQGDVVLSSAQVYLQDNVMVGGILFLGTMDDIQASGFSPNVPANFGTHEIIRASGVPNIKGSQTLIKAYLK